MTARLSSALCALALAALLPALSGCVSEPTYYSDGDHGGSYYYGERYDHRVYSSAYVSRYDSWPVFGGYGRPYCCGFGDPWFWSGYGYGPGYFGPGYYGWGGHASYGNWDYRPFVPYRHGYEHYRQRYQAGDWRHADRAGDFGARGAREQIERINMPSPQPRPSERSQSAPQSEQRAPLGAQSRRNDDNEVVRWDRPRLVREDAGSRDSGAVDRNGAGIDANRLERRADNGRRDTATRAGQSAGPERATRAARSEKRENTRNAQGHHDHEPRSRDRDQ